MNEYIKIALQADPVGMVTGFREAEGAMAKFGSAFQSTMKTVQAGGQAWDSFTGSIKSAGTKMLGMGVGTTAFFGGAVASAMSFQTELQNVRSLTKQTAEATANDAKALVDMSTRLPQSATELGAGLYDIASSGYSGADGLEILEQSAIAASAGMTTAATSSEAIVAIMNAYGMSAADAADISDILFQTVNVGVLTFDELASSVGTWVGMAATAGVAADEAAAAIAAMTLSGIKADSASTYLSRIMQEFLDPKDTMTALVQEMGYENAKALLDAEGLGGALLELNNAVGGDAVAFNELFGSIQATRGAMAITANEGLNYARAAEQVTDKTNRAGAAQEVYAVQAETLRVQLKLFFNNIKSYMINIGSVLIGPITAVVKAGNAILEFFAKLPQPIKTVLTWIGALGAILMTVVGAIMTFGSAMLAAKLAMIAFNAAMGMPMMQGMFGWLLKLGSMVTGVTSKLTAMAMAKRVAMKVGAAEAANMSGMVGTAGKGIAKSMLIGGAGIAAFMGVTELITDFNNAKKAGQELVDVFKQDVDTKTLGGLRTGLRDVQKEIDDARTKLDDITGNGTGGMDVGQAIGETLGSFVSWVPGLGNLGSSGEEFIAQQERLDQLKAYQDELKQREELQGQAAALAGAVALGTPTFQVSKNTRNVSPVDPDDFGSFTMQPPKDSIDDYYNVTLEEILNGSNWLAENARVGMQNDMDGLAQAMGLTNSNALQAEFERGMAALDLNINDLMEFDDEGAFKGWKEGAEENIEAVGSWIQKMGALSPAAQEVAIAFADMGDSADSSTSNIEKLGNALEAVFNQEFGYEAAKDNLEGLVNSAYKTIDEIKTEGDFGQAQDFGSFSEDALALRSELRGVMEGMNEEITAWAMNEGEVTGSGIAQHVAENIAMFREYGAEMGLSNETIEHYVEGLAAVVANGDIQIAFSDNAEDANNRLELYLTTLGATPEKIATTVELLNSDKSRDEVTMYLLQLGYTPDQVTTIINAQVNDAYSQLTSYLGTLGEIDQIGTVTAIVEAKVEGNLTDPAVREQISNTFGIEDKDIDVIAELTGEGLTQTEVLKKLVAELSGSEANPEVSLKGYSTTKTQLENIKSLIMSIPTSRRTEIQVIESRLSTGQGNYPVDKNPPGRGDGHRRVTEADGSIHFRSFGDGGFGHLPDQAIVKKPQGKGLVQWAEPETGGEAFIPMAPAKRARSEAILSYVANEFGGRFEKYAGGGLSGRFRPGTLASEKKAEQDRKDSEQRQKESQKASEQAAKDAEEARKDARAAADAAHDFFWEAGMMGPDQYIANMQAAQNETKAFSAEWWQMASKIQQFKDDLFGDASAANDFFRENDLMGDEQYLKHLQDRLNYERAYSKEWWSIQQKIVDEKKEIKQRDEAIQDAAFRYGAQSLTDRVAQLRKRAAAEKTFSKEWWAIAEEIRQIEDTGAERRNKYNNNFNDGKYVAWLKDQIAKTEMFSDRWDELMDKVASIEGTALDKATGDVFGKFGDSKAVSPASLMRYMGRQIQMAETWKATVDQLKATGAYGEGVINRLISMGPDSIGLVKALMKAAQTGQSGTINDMFNSAMNIGLNMNAAPGGNYLPVGYTQPATNWRGGDPGAMKGTTVIVNLPGATIASANDAQRLGDRIAYSINAVGV